MSYYETAANDRPGKTRRVDGRRQRSERTRLTIIEAYLELLRRDPRMPTAAQIAAEAGYSTRSIFERFNDLNALTLATADHALVQGQADAAPRDAEADRPTRIHSHAAVRAKACERWLSLWRVLVATQHELAELKTRVTLVRLANIERMRMMYQPELSTMPEPEREEILIALATLISFESWDQMRSCYKLSSEDAQAIWRSSIDRMLPPTPMGAS